MAGEDLEDLKDLPPEERIQKLEEILEEKQDELKEAEELIKKSKKEASEIKKERRIEEFIKKLTLSEEEDTEISEEGDEGSEESQTLEESVEAEQGGRASSTEETNIEDLSRKPVEYFQNVFEEVTRDIYEGDVTEAEMQRFEYASQGWSRKLQDIQEGQYSPPKEVLTEAVIETERARDMVTEFYQQDRSEEGTDFSPSEEDDRIKESDSGSVYRP